MTTSREALDPDLAGPVPTLPPGGQRRRLTLAGQPKPVARARAFTSAALVDWSWPAPDQGQDIVLLVAELVANAMLHAGGPLELVLDASATRLRIEVSDGSTALPEPRRPHRPGLPGGHGLFIVEQTADRWGAEAHRQGKTIWAEIAPSS
ncbi:ATP-binding protein [Kitasatospora viridis]|uniref:Anti-sigma regulatory factor (Ser/Thr protein kinase) n=1 Tax=Kitasatospora viridis TaxID=281105 RepID=A0A561SDV3_9ACTN|nr:ATP-binding protein [Kitasatospora viridis]TWF73027.1 anti-sigma regulatory factor (Ser/Thr protein kinase) [Kitasatospora viridis]